MVRANPGATSATAVKLNVSNNTDDVICGPYVFTLGDVDGPPPRFPSCFSSLLFSSYITCGVHTSHEAFDCFARVAGILVERECGMEKKYIMTGNYFTCPPYNQQRGAQIEENIHWPSGSDSID